MAFINEIYLYKKIFRDIENAAIKCVPLNSAIKINIYYEKVPSQQKQL